MRNPVLIISLRLSSQLFYFIAIGASSALVHLITVLNLVRLLELNPLIANIFAFFLAFNISYLGHKYLTFSKLGKQKLSLPHFFFVATSAGIMNEALYGVLLHYTEINYLIALILVLGLVAIYSFLLSRFWACR